MFCTCAKHLRRDIDLLCTLCALNSMVTSVVVMKHFSTHLFTSVSASIESIEGKANIRVSKGKVGVHRFETTIVLL